MRSSRCAGSAPDPPAGVEADEVWLIDSPDAADNPNLDFVLADLADAITRFQDEGKTVFLHCVAGENRTPAAAAAYLVRRFGIEPGAAFAQVNAVLPNSCPRTPCGPQLTGSPPEAPHMPSGQNGNPVEAHCGGGRAGTTNSFIVVMASVVGLLPALGYAASPWPPCGSRAGYRSGRARWHRPRRNVSVHAWNAGSRIA